MRSWNKTKVAVQTSGDKGSGAKTISNRIGKETLGPYKINFKWNKKLNIKK